MDIVKNVLQAGSLEFSLDAYCRCSLKASEAVTLVKKVTGGVDQFVATGKRFRFNVGRDDSNYELIADDHVLWAIDYVHPSDCAEQLDNTPIEVVLDEGPSLEQKIKQIIRQEYYRLAQSVEEPGSFEEEDDFELEDDDMTSAYSVIDMIEEVIDGGEPELDPDKTPNNSPAEPEEATPKGADKASAEG